MKAGDAFVYEDIADYKTLEGVSEEDFKKTMLELVSKGLAKEIIVDGVMQYALTDLGVVVGEHMDSDPSKQN